ncbi:hypothetical protein MKZ38_006077 [Zalerion maritima]|uniref:VPS9 domain-containing protein n=1 Tax=Zalerion maritima TaxID=339359 RepID=A0AAD5WVX6_9PEZI|nr:hypothetical protein MKZ38_006077 [Zalerion maritima]
MASKAPPRASPNPHGSLRNTRSFTRIQEPDNSRQRPKRASTFQNASTGPLGAGDDGNTDAPDAFETNSGDDEPEVHRSSIDLDDLPIEVISMVDNFIDSLSARVNPTPPKIHNLSQRFQDFYVQAADRIRTHIKALATRQQRRDVSPTPSNSSRISAASLFRAKAASLSGSREKLKETAHSGPLQQMLTPNELLDRKRQRKALEAKRGHLEEAVERRLCEGIYDKIYRHHSTQDEAQDAKLRSKTAALDMVRIGPLELGVDLGEETPEGAAKKVLEVREHLEAARKEMVLMNQKRYPLAKLHHLKTAHKEIVDTLSHFHPSSSADEIMPMLIFTLITLPPENLTVISDLCFVQRFRWEPKLVGEAAYCLTNLEAAISFLDTVDLSALRSDESPSGPAKEPSRPGSPKTETFPPAYTGSGLAVPSTVTGSPETTTSNATSAKLLASPSGLRAAVQLRNRRLSDLVQTPAQAIGAASDTIFTTADQGIKTISTSLGDSYKFLMGKLGAVPNTVGGAAPVQVPQTLEDARKLIGTPPPEGDDDDGTVSDVGTDDQSLPDNTSSARPIRPSVEDRVLSLVSGKKGSVAMARDRSAESVRSVSSTSKKVVFADSGKPEKGSGNAAVVTSAPGQQVPPGASASSSGLTGSVLSLGTSLNPVARLGAGMNMIRGFGRSTSTPAVVPTGVPPGGPPALGNTAKDHPTPIPEGGDLATAFPDIAPVLPPKEAPKIAPPIQRFMEIEDPGELKLREALELLKDYRRLAVTLKSMDAFEDS